MVVVVVVVALVTVATMCGVLGCVNTAFMSRLDVIKNGYSSSQQDLTISATCHMGSQCYLPPGRGDIPAVYPSQLRLVLNLATPKGCQAELT